MGSRRVRARFGALMTSLVIALSVAGVASATELHQSTPITWDDTAYRGDDEVCSADALGPGLVVWHFVLLQAESNSGTLTVTFVDAGTSSALNDRTAGGVLYWSIPTLRDTLLAASTDTNGSVLALSYICVGPEVSESGETPAGSNVVVTAAYSGGQSPAQLTFSSVLTAGTTTVTTSATAPALPTGYSVGDPVTYYDLQTTATYSGLIAVCLSFAGQTPAPTALLHYENGAWTEVTSSIDSDNQVICGMTTSLSPFAAVHLTVPTFVGFLQPLNDPISASNPMSVFKRGSTVPVKFMLRYADGSTMPDAIAADLVGRCAITLSLSQAGTSAPAVDEAATTAAPTAGTCFRYEASIDQFVFNLGTKGLAAPASYIVTATVAASNSSVLLSHTLVIGLR